MHTNRHLNVSHIKMGVIFTSWIGSIKHSFVEITTLITLFFSNAPSVAIKLLFHATFTIFLGQMTVVPCLTITENHADDADATAVRVVYLWQSSHVILVHTHRPRN